MRDLRRWMWGGWKMAKNSRRLLHPMKIWIFCGSFARYPSHKREGAQLRFLRNARPCCCRAQRANFAPRHRGNPRVRGWRPYLCSTQHDIPLCFDASLPTANWIFSRLKKWSQAIGKRVFWTAGQAGLGMGRNAWDRSGAGRIFSTRSVAKAIIAYPG